MAIIDTFLVFTLVCVAAHSCHVLLLEYAKARLPLSMVHGHSIRYMPVASTTFSLIISVMQNFRKLLHTGLCSEE